MVSEAHLAYTVNDRSYFAILKREIHTLAVKEKFSETKVGEIDIIVAELVSNLVRHGEGGRVLVKPIYKNGIHGLEIISIDNGPGMTDVTRMLADGVSTKNSLGQGLGAMKRLSNLFQVFSIKEWGTVMLIRIFDKNTPAFNQPSRAEIGSTLISKPGQPVCGDGFFYRMNENYLKLFLGDGLGHGTEANKAVEAAGQAFLDCSETDPAEIIYFINNAVKKTRGLVGTVAVYDFSKKKWKICGVGNIGTKISSPSQNKNYMSYNGIIGLNVPNSLNSQETPYEAGQVLIMASDGLKTRWDTIRYPSIYRYDLSVLCATLIKDFARFTDDMSVVSCKIN